MNFLTVQEAIELTGRSQSTISRYCRKYADTKHIKRVGKEYRLDKTHLISQFGLNNQNTHETKDYSIVEQLKDENSYLRERLEEVQTIIREQNMVITYQTKQLQDRNSQQQPKATPEQQPATGSNIIWVVLGIVLFALILSIVFVDEIRSALE